MPDDLRTGHRRRRRRGDARDPPRPLPGSSPAPRTCPTSCSTCTRRRQLVGLGAILERIEGDLRAAPVLAALRLAFLHAILPASRLGTGPGRTAALRVSSGTSGRRPAPSSASATRGSPSRTPSGSSAASSSGSRAATPGRSRLVSARTCAASARAPRPRSLGLSGPRGLVAAARRSRGLRADRTDAAGPARARPAADATEPRTARGRYHAHGLGPRSRGGRPAAARGARRCLAAARRGAGRRRPSGGRSSALEPSMARDGRVVQLVDGSAGGDRRGRPRRRGRRLPTGRRSTGRPRRRRRRDRRADPAGRRPAARRPDAGQRRPEPVPGGAGDPTSSRARPVRAARAVRRAAVLAPRMPPGP